MLGKHFSSINELFTNLPDPRKRSEYTINELAWGALLMSLLKCKSRNAFNNLRRENLFQENLEKQFNINLPHCDAVDDVFRQIEPESLEKLKIELIKRYMEQKKLRDARMADKYYLIAVDATGIASFDHKHCEHCLTKTSKNGVITYFHYVLEAKLVTNDGLSISMATEFIENPTGQEFDKQDCEQKAFVRLAKKLKKNFPRLPICILADGLYPNQTVFDICHTNEWKYIITLKDKSLKTFQEEAKLLAGTAKTVSIKRKDKLWKYDLTYSYLNDIPYKDKNYSWISCNEKRTSPKGIELEPRNFVYITNIVQDADNVVLTAYCGRLRWRIENEGFNAQKNQGYELEHQFSRISYTAMKNYYHIVQIAHFVNQLVERLGVVMAIQNEHSKTTITDLWQKLKAYLVFVDYANSLNQRE